MAKQTVDTPVGQATVDLEKYTELVLKVDEAQDKIKEMEALSKELQVVTASMLNQYLKVFGHSSEMRMISMRNQSLVLHHSL